MTDKPIDYATSDSDLPFSDYINHCERLIRQRRGDLKAENAQHIVDTNKPFELLPSSNKPSIKYGALLIHGLLDSPFSLKDIGISLQSKGVHCRSILLPGHGTTPSDLNSIHFQDWLQAVKYGVDSFKKEVDKLFLIGYSTGAALSLAHALKDPDIAGLVLLSPAIRLRAPVSIVVGWHYLLKKFGRNNREWVYQSEEIDYAKYQSIGFNAVRQVEKLTRHLQRLRKKHSLKAPLFMIISREDETVSCSKAVHFFSSFDHPISKLLLYAANTYKYADKRIQIRPSSSAELRIKHFSHISLPFALDNPHYGQFGDHVNASRMDATYWYGAYNKIEIDLYEVLYRLGMIEHKRRELTFNPDFEYMSQSIYQFLSANSPQGSGGPPHSVQS